MPRVGIRELKNRTTEILRAVREESAEYLVTYRGEPAAVILPMDERWREMEQVSLLAAEPSADVWAELEALRKEIDSSWQAEENAAALITEQRR